MKYTRKPEVVEAFTFEEFIEYGKKHAKHSSLSSNDMPWSFDFMGVPVTHETDKCYLITTSEDMLSFTPDHILTVDYLNGMAIYLKGNFKELFLPHEK